MVHSDDAQPGISRRGSRRFRYEHPDGSKVVDASTVERIGAMAIPPAWTDVWICADPNGHVQATGRDARGRKQFRYHVDHRAAQEQTKFDQLVVFGASLTRLRTAVALDLAERRPTARRQTALVVHLLDRTGIRIGNEKYARTNGSFGLSTLRTRQAHVNGGAITFRFVGKGGRKHTVTLADRRLARLVSQCQDLPGQRLFTFLDDDGGPHAIGSTAVNDYIRDATGEPMTAKTFRTWLATEKVTAGLAATPRTDPTKQRFLAAVDEAAELLGNTRTVCRSSYVHPVVERSYFDGSLLPTWRAGPSRPTVGLTTAERRTLHVLRTGGTDADA